MKYHKFMAKIESFWSLIVKKWCTIEMHIYFYFYRSNSRLKGENCVLKVTLSEGIEVGYDFVVAHRLCWLCSYL